MKKLLTFSGTLLLVLFATNAFAERGRGWSDNAALSKGDRIERHMDRAGDRIERRFEHKAERAEHRGHYRQADRFRAKGQQINRHLDHKGHRLHSRFEHRVKYYGKGYWAPHPKQVVVYQAPRHYPNRSFNVMIRQPGLWFGGAWRH